MFEGTLSVACGIPNSPKQVNRAARRVGEVDILPRMIFDQVISISDPSAESPMLGQEFLPSGSLVKHLDFAE